MTRRFDFAPLPALSESSNNWTNLILTKASDLARHTQMSLADVLQLPLSFDYMYYSSDAWSQRKLELENEYEKYNTLVKIGNAIIKSLNQR